MSTRVLLLLVSWWPVAGCIEANRAQGGLDGAGDTAEATDTASPLDGVGEDGVGADTRPAACGVDNPCAQPQDACLEAVCVDGACQDRARVGAPCDDGNPCTELAICEASGECKPGKKLKDDTECAPATMCAGPGLCKSGSCQPPVTVSCPAPTRACREAACDEATGGCVERVSADATPCGAGRACDGGRCVPAGMRTVAAGEFTMGCDDTFCGLNARPSHRVWLSTYAIDLLEVTNAEYAACAADVAAGEARCPARIAADIGVHDGPQLAAVGLTWRGAALVCAYYGKQLCTEAQWEKAARGDDARLYPWGTSPAPSCARAIMSEVVGGTAGCGLGRQAAPGTRPQGASPYGALDMAGNVAEWVADRYDRDAYGRRSATEVTIDPLETEESTLFPATGILRGGGWKDAAAADLRATARRPALLTPIDADDIGVRCCFIPEDPGPTGEAE